MKTTKFLYAALAITLAFVSCQKETIEPQSDPSNAMLKTTPAKMNEKFNDTRATINVRYEVVIHSTINRPLCNTYQVEILDEHNNLVAPPQRYIPGNDTYYFDEQTRQKSGTRIALLVLDPNLGHIACETELFTPAVIKVIQFENGESYRFDLNPKPYPVKDLD